MDLMLAKIAYLDKLRNAGRISEKLFKEGLLLLSLPRLKGLFRIHNLWSSKTLDNMINDPEGWIDVVLASEDYKKYRGAMLHAIRLTLESDVGMVKRDVEQASLEGILREVHISL